MNGYRDATPPAPMAEDELLAGITDALTIAGWLWMHIIRSDGVTMGRGGLPDVLAVHPQRELVLAWELKSAHGQIRPDQLAWLLAFNPIAGIDARIIRPVDYDAALAVIIRGTPPAEAFES